MSELLDHNADLMAALASLQQHPVLASHGAGSSNSSGDPGQQQHAQGQQQLLQQTDHSRHTMFQLNQQAYLQQAYPDHQAPYYHVPSEPTQPHEPPPSAHPYSQQVGNGGGSEYASPSLGMGVGTETHGSHSPSQNALVQAAAQHQHPAPGQPQALDDPTGAYGLPSSSSGVGGQQTGYYDNSALKAASSNGNGHMSTSLAPSAPTAAPPSASKTRKGKKVRPPPDPNAPPPPPKRPKPLPKREPLQAALGSENGESDGAGGKPVVMPTHKEVHTIIEDRYKSLRRLFTKKAGLTGGPGRPPTKPQPTRSDEIVKLHALFPNSAVLPYLTAEIGLEKPKTLLSFLGGSKTTKLTRSSSTATWYVWSLAELRSVRDGLSELHEVDGGEPWAALNFDARAKLEAVEIEVEAVLEKVEEGMLKVFGAPVHSREDDPTPGDDLNPPESQVQEVERLGGSYTGGTYHPQAYEKAGGEEGNAVASSSKTMLREPPASLADLRQIYPGKAILPHLLPNLTLKTAKVMGNFLSGAGVTKRTPDEKTRQWYTKNITSYRHAALSLVEMRGYKSTWESLLPSMRRRLEALEGEVSERLVKLKEGRFEVFGVNDDDDEMKGRAADEAHDDAEDDDEHSHHHQQQQLLQQQQQQQSDQQVAQPHHVQPRDHIPSHDPQHADPQQPEQYAADPSYGQLDPGMVAAAAAGDGQHAHLELLDHHHLTTHHPY